MKIKPQHIALAALGAFLLWKKKSGAVGGMGIASMPSKEKSWRIKDQFPIKVFVEKSWNNLYYVIDAPPMSMSYDTFIDLGTQGTVDVLSYDYKNGEARFTAYHLDDIKEWSKKNKDRITVIINI